MPETTPAFADVIDNGELRQKITRLLSSREWPEVCRVIGAYFERLCSELAVNIPNSEGMNQKARLDALIRIGIVPRVLGAKMHAVRELRNAATHPTPYLVTDRDAQFCNWVFEQAISWLGGDAIGDEWRRLLGRFDTATGMIQSDDQFAGPSGHSYRRIVELYSILDDAAFLLAQSLGLSAGRRNLFANLDTLSESGVHFKNTAWERLVSTNAIMKHGATNAKLTSGLKAVQQDLPELRALIEKMEDTFRTKWRARVQLPTQSSE